MLLAACAASPIAVTCVDANGAPVDGANVTLHANGADGSTVVLAQDAQRIGCATVERGEQEQPTTVWMWPRETIRGRVQVPAGHTAPVHVSVVRSSISWRQRDDDRRREQDMERTWSPALHTWLPAVGALETTTAPDGTFVVSVAKDVSTILAFTSPGLAMTQQWARSEGELAVRMFAERRVEVLALDAGSRPIAGAEVRLFEPTRTCGNDAEPWLLAWRQRTRADGTASFDGVPLGSFFESLRTDGAAMNLNEVELFDEGTTAVTLRVDPGIRVHGFVRDADGRGVAGVAVIVTVDLLLAAGTARTDADGAYELRIARRGLGSAILRLAELPAGWRDTIDMHGIDIAAIDGNAHRLDFVLQRR